MFSILEALPHRDSISSSLLSDWLSLIDRRLSFSTLTSSRQSASKVSLADTDISYTECKAADVLVGLSNTVNQANRVLIEECCIKNEDCRHRLISSLSTELLNDPAGSHVQSLAARLTTSLIVQSPGDSYGNNELFFAARVGVAPDVILSLLAVTQNVNAVNADGQTFLFFLNLRFFQSEGPPCRCPGIDGHATRFECLVRALDRRQYDFDHLDNYGRNFLSLMSSSDHFDANWVADLMSRDTTWRYRVECMSQARDAHGNFLLDFLSLHPAYDAMSEDILCKIRPCVPISQFDLWCYEDREGRSRLHQRVLEGSYFQTNPAVEFRERLTDGLCARDALDINRYDRHGRTPIMDFLLKAFETGLSEHSICERVEHLIRDGANVNARSRGGSTILHFAAKKALPQLMQVLLTHNVQVDHQDESGHSAIDYAVKVLQRSRSAKTKAEAMARSLKSTTTLLGLTKPRAAKSPDFEDRQSAKVLQERSEKTLQQLSGARDQVYPPALMDNSSAPEMNNWHQLFAGSKSRMDVSVLSRQAAMSSPSSPMRGV
jgi:hypothetical protein